MKVVAKNRRARFDFEIVDTVEAGVMLTGPEVKSCRLGHVNLAGSYVSFLAGRPVIKQMSIAAYKQAATLPHEPLRDRELLLKKNEAGKLAAQSAEKGVAIVPLEVRAGKYVKVLIGIGKGRKTIDKRQRIRERDEDRKLRSGKEI